jgi:Glycosyltransferase family 87
VQCNTSMKKHFEGTLANIVVVALLLLVETSIFQPVRQKGQHDFMAFYLGGEVAASGQIARIYDKPVYQPLIAQLRKEGERMSALDAHYFIRPAFEAFFYIPFTWCSYSQAATLALIVNLGLLSILVWKLPIWFAVPAAICPAARMALAVFYPFLWSIQLGQDTLLLALLVGYAFSRNVVGGDPAAGCIIGLCAWKPHLIALLPFGLMAACRWRMAICCLATSSALLGLSFGLVGVTGFHQWVQLVQASSSDITPSLMGNIRALSIHFGLVFAAIALALTMVSFYLALRHGSFPDKMSASLIAALLVSPHTYWQDYSLAAVIAMLGLSPVARIVFLLPWPYLYSRKDELPMIFISLSYLIALGVKQAFRPAPDLVARSAIRRIADV